MNAPAGWIPPEFRKHITVPLTKEEKDLVRSCVAVYDEDGNLDQELADEMVEDLSRIIGTEDLRDNSFHPIRGGW